MVSCRYCYARPDGCYDLSEFYQPDAEPVRALAEQLLSQCEYFDIQEISEVAYNWVATNIMYCSDRKRWGYPEYWQFPEETLMPVNGQLFGDCEDTSFLLASLLIAMGVPEDRVRVAISDSHAWVEVKLDDGNWYALETTDDTPLERWVLAHDVYNEAEYYVPEVYVYRWGCVDADC